MIIISVILSCGVDKLRIIILNYHGDLSGNKTKGKSDK